jgi:hypothetical protein
LFLKAHKEIKRQKMIDAPEPFDVLLGRGKPIQKRLGNKLIRLLIDKNSHRYDKAPRLEKRAIANEIVQSIKSNNGKLPGRFLRLCGSAEQEGWKEVSDAVAIDKVSHIFRARRNLAQESSSSGSLLAKRMREISAVADDFSRPAEKYSFITTPTTLGPRPLLFDPQNCQQEGQSARPPASVTTTSSFHYAIHAASNSSLIIGAGQHASSDMIMWTPPCHEKTSTVELVPEKSCNGEKEIKKELSLDDRAAAAPRLTHYHYYFPEDQGLSGSANNGDKNNAMPL